MRKYPVFGVLALALLLSLAGVNTLWARDHQMQNNSCDAEKCCRMVDGKCVPCTGTDCAGKPCKPCKPGECSQSRACNHKTEASLSGAKADASQGCGHGPCKPCPSGQKCSGQSSCKPSGCARMTARDTSPRQHSDHAARTSGIDI